MDSTITAKQFIDDNYTAKIKMGECIVCDTVDGSEVFNLEQKWRGSYAYTWTDKLGAQWGCHDAEEFTVTWYEQPQAASADAVAGAGDDPLVVKYGDGYEAGYADGLKDYEAQQAEIDGLRKRVAELEATLKPFADAYDGYFEHCKNAKYDGDIRDYLNDFYASGDVENMGVMAVAVLAEQAAKTVQS